MNTTPSSLRPVRQGRRRQRGGNNPYGFIHHGARVLWNDPGAADYGPDRERHLKSVYVVHSVAGATGAVAVSGEDTVLIYEHEGHSEAEVPARELRPYRPGGASDIDVKHADAFLLSAIKYADRRMRRAEEAAREAEDRALLAQDRLDTLLATVPEELRAIKKERVYQEQQALVKNLSAEVGDLRQELDFYRSAYLTSKQAPARPLASFGEGGFINTPDHLGRFLARCPLREPQATDPEVRVVVEDAEGERNPVTGVWYDPLTGEIRITF